MYSLDALEAKIEILRDKLNKALETDNYDNVLEISRALDNLIVLQIRISKQQSLKKSS